MAGPLSPRARQVQETLAALGLSPQVMELPRSTRTAEEAAAAVGCALGQIAKSLVFKGVHSQKPILVVASGANRVNETRMAALVGEPIEKADAEFVRACTGYAIGGVPPAGHRQRLETFIDEDLLQYTEIWAAGGTPNALVRLSPAELVRITEGRVVRIT